ncbi:MAG: sigma-70 family RNA polymerase sigma factor [Bacteroidales bacterium]|nr:sigma-70 family RNA polymerase sigma factor [Bacteroidales bacterium]
MEQISFHQNIINKICFIYCRNASDKEDLYQEIVLQLWKSYPTFDGRSAFSTWMYRVALNTAITATRKWRFFADISRLPDIACDNEALMVLSEEVKLLYEAIAQLDKIEKAIILLWLENKSYEEISGTIGISVKNVSVKLVRIKSRLAKMLRHQ